MLPSEFPPHWLLTYFLLGWAFSWIAVRNGRWAALGGLTTLLAMVFILHRVPLMFATVPVQVAGVVLGVVLLVLAAQWPLTGRVLSACLLAPLLTVLILRLGFLLFISVFQIP